MTLSVLLVSGYWNNNWLPKQSLITNFPFRCYFFHHAGTHIKGSSYISTNCKICMFYLGMNLWIFDANVHTGYLWSSARCNLKAVISMLSVDKWQKHLRCNVWLFFHMCALIDKCILHILRSKILHYFEKRVDLAWTINIFYFQIIIFLMDKQTIISNLMFANAFKLAGNITVAN